ncbi:M60 family metallopeptidase [Luteolibacter flavescens]|uniref:M60 family metallopeptidase n=1 Tax=Luteolibacter flavescens TaxID=1859460 RepID=A0ABT3FSW6_9BACT|nr:M60 family metallopeptidase [Luteolibacter flavescens]MCW1886677.1 M60 family metallopeptidase [Luteolibacter flavescens]
MVTLKQSALWAMALAALPISHSAAQEKERTEERKGKHVSVSFRKDDWALLGERKDFIPFLDSTYLTMAELTNHRPPMTLRGYRDLGAWGTAGLDGVNIDWNFVPGLLTDFTKDKVEFGVLHEMGHVFDARNHGRWYITPSAGGETFANIKLSYAVECLLTDEAPYRIEFGPGGMQTGRAFNDNFYLNKGEEYLAGSQPWTAMDVDALHAFHLHFVRLYGWDVYKKWFRAYQVIEEDADGRAPESTEDPIRMQMVCALLSAFCGENLVPEFQRWRMPVTDEDVATLTKKHRLASVVKRVNADFAREFTKGGINLDPLSLAIRPQPGKESVTIFSIFSDLPKTEVRYSIDGSAPARYTGTPVKVASSKTIEASLHVPGKRDAILKTRRTIP